jgi:hypothetical protein
MLRATVAAALLLAEPAPEPAPAETPAPAVAPDPAPEAVRQPQEVPLSVEDLTFPSRNEHWYLFTGLGFSAATYSGRIQQAAEALSIDGILRATVNADVSAYLPLTNQRTLLGGGLNVVNDRWSDLTGSLQITQLTLAGSAMHFFGENIGDGVFARGDAGITLNGYLSSITDVETRFRTSSLGLSALLGGGYAIAITHETRILLGANFAVRRTDDGTFRTLNLNVGFLF